MMCYALLKEDDDMATFSERLKGAMELRDIDRATLLRITGIDKGAFSSYINGKYNAGQANLYLLAKALNVNEAWLMGHDVPMERNTSMTEPLPESFDSFAEVISKLSPAARQQALDYMKFLATLEQQGK